MTSIDRQMSRSSSTTRMRSGNSFPQAAGRLEGVLGAEDGTAGDEHVSTRVGGHAPRLLVDAAVHLQCDLEAPLVDLGACCLHLVHDVFDERLAAEAGMHGHQQEQVD